MQRVAATHKDLLSGSGNRWFSSTVGSCKEVSSKMLFYCFTFRLKIGFRSKKIYISKAIDQNPTHPTQRELKK